MASIPVNNSPAELVAIIRAAHIAGDRELEHRAKAELRERFGIVITFTRKDAVQEVAVR